jgi:DNA (cytosine-5)-methyltransferase 1
MTAYYNEIDSYAAQWLRNLIAAGLIAPGDVDERSIEDVYPGDLKNYTQCHFFAGIGVWSLALRNAGWPDDRPVWTGSCPCQPFSSAGKAAGFADERHLWPAFFHLIEKHRPPILFGEQVASKDADPWIDLVQADLETLGFAFGAVAFPSAGIGAPHIRDRTYWVADRDGVRWSAIFGQSDGRLDCGTDDERAFAGLGLSREVSGLGDDDDARLEGLAGHDGAAGRQGSERPIAEAGVSSGLGYPQSDRPEMRQHLHRELPRQGLTEGRIISGVADTANSAGQPGVSRAAIGRLSARDGGNSELAEPGPTNGYWRDADWLGCRDGKWRPVEPGTFPLAHGAAARVGRLRAYGNAINAIQAQVFIEAYLNK